MMLGSLSDGRRTGHRWAGRQTYISLGVFLASADDGHRRVPNGRLPAREYDEILGLKEKRLGAVVIATAGYRSADDKIASLAKVRFDAKDVVEHV